MTPMPTRYVITIGNFDGVHLGHQAILSQAAARARLQGCPLKVLTFDPHPASVLRPGNEPSRITTQQRKRELLIEHGADEVEILVPTHELLALEPQAFIEKLVREHHPIAFFEGNDFRFGRARAGDVHTLGAMGAKLDYEAVIVPDEQVALSDHLLAPVSSSLVRWLLSNGRVADASICLGRAFELRGVVVKGDQRGRTLGVPTANLDGASLAGRAMPADGVYAGLVQVGDEAKTHAAAISIGIKPTFTTKSRTVEAHLLDYKGDLYGKTITIHFVRWLREQQAFPSLDHLKSQLNRDVKAVRELDQMRLLLLKQPVSATMA